MQILFVIKNGTSFNELMTGWALPLQQPGMSQAQYDKLVNDYQAHLDAALKTVYSEFFLIAAVVALLAVIPAVLLLKGRRAEGRIPLLPQ